MISHSRNHTQRRDGFTLVEVLIVVGILGILMALLLSAVQGTRASARRLHCSNNMKQVAAALHMHHKAYGHFPHGTYNYIDTTFRTPPPYGNYPDPPDSGNDPQDRRCWMHDTLPYLEFEDLFRDFKAHMDAGNSALGFADLARVVPTLMCPSDPVSPKLETYWGGLNGLPTQGFSGNVVVSAGSGYFNEGGVEASAKLNGIFFAISRVTDGQISDGLTNTVMVSELILSPDTNSHDIRGRYYNPAHGGVLFSTRLPPNNDISDRLNWCGKNPVSEAPCIWSATNMHVSVRSHHRGGVNVSMADGSVHFLSDTIDPVLFKALGSRNGGEVSLLP